MITGTAYDVLIHQRIFEIKSVASQENNGTTGVFLLIFLILKHQSIQFFLVRIKLTDESEKIVAVRRKEPGVFGKVLVCFSVYTNTKLIFSTKLSKDSVAPIHGIRFLGMFWIIMIHTVFYMSDYAGEVYIEMKKLKK